MNLFHLIFKSGVRRDQWRFRIDFFWLLGLCFGVFCHCVSAGAAAVWIRGSDMMAASVPAFLVCLWFPFFLSLLFFYGLGPGTLPAVCFAKAFTESFVFLAVRTAYGSAGWLVCFLLMFSDFLLTPVLYFFWLRLPGRSIREQISVFLWVVAFSIFVGWIDYRLVLPFTATLIEGCL